MQVKRDKHCTYLFNLKEQKKEAEGDSLCLCGGDSKTNNNSERDTQVRREEQQVLLCLGGIDSKTDNHAEWDKPARREEHWH